MWQHFPKPLLEMLPIYGWISGFDLQGNKANAHADIVNEKE